MGRIKTFVLSIYIILAVTGCNASLVQQDIDKSVDYTKSLSQIRAIYFVIFASVLIIVLVVVSFLLMRNKRLGNKLVERINAITISQQSLQTVLDALPIPVRIVDLKSSDIVYVNDSFVEMFEYNTSEEVYGLKLSDILPETTSDGIKSSKLIETTINSSKLISFEVDYKTKSGKIIESLLSTRHIDYKGKKSSIGIIKDLTAEKERSRILLDAAEREREANQSKSSFLANMSHEIRTPMNGIIGFSELALDSGVSMEAKDDYIKKIKASGEGLLKIINDILDISKVEAGKIELENIPFDINDVFRLCRSIISPKAIEKGIELYCYAEPSIGKKLLGDPTRLRQVLLNLLSNAVKFTNTGMVKLLSSITNSDENSVTMAFEVKDNGIGMTQEQIDKIFEPFTQADNSTTRKYGGTGLGLAISKNIIEVMGSELKVKSTIGLGSKFTFELTFKTISNTEGINEQDIIMNMTSAPIFNGEILVFEDNATNQQVISEHLAKVGINTVIAENGKIGVNMVNERMKKGEKPFDLIFMDIHMPIMDGFQAAQKLTELGNKTPIVAVTANVMLEDKEAYRMHGMPDYLAKPFQARELWACLLKYLTPIESKKIESQDNYLDDEDMRIKLQSTFVEDYKDAVNNINCALEEGDIKSAHRIVHTLKGLAALFGKNSLQEVAKNLESSLKSEAAFITSEQMIMFDNELNQVLNEFMVSLEEANKHTTIIKHLNEDEALIIFKKLEPLLKSSNTNAIELIDKLKGIQGAEELIKLIDSYEFEDAYKVLKELLKQYEGNNNI